MSIWRDVVGLEGLFVVSDEGEVKSLARHVERVNDKGFFKPEKILSRWTTQRGYLASQLGARYFFVHRLVADAFIPNPSKSPQVNHIDGDKQNNNASNLEWVTPLENSQHAYATGLARNLQGVAHGMTKLSEDDVICIRVWTGLNYSFSELGKIFGVSATTISGISNRLGWTHLQDPFDMPTRPARTPRRAPPNPKVSHGDKKWLRENVGSLENKTVAAFFDVSVAYARRLTKEASK